MDQAAKKRLKAEFKAKRRAALCASLPMPLARLKALFSFLDRLDAPPCDHSLTQTRVFLHQQGLAPELVVPWLNEHGGYCDCEVLANVHDEVGDLIGWYVDEER
ncbi:hypothetical protein A6D6_01898 [Alcanivorax xiamenensis]|uniref:DUF2695 domain-containing protein n=1 Tax=Alcanivorax xiamenensis TaxID=1177156 RepID=A0ABQ6Y9G8_9GAMM|nr:MULTISPECIES: DUF2695 domain-containing protein [Alcanivorax]KAF0806080.1 hypothetical protein A6D6_01898 [Alcanivorax xiamenensis]